MVEVGSRGCPAGTSPSCVSFCFPRSSMCSMQHVRPDREIVRNQTVRGATWRSPDKYPMMFQKLRSASPTGSILQAIRFQLSGILASRNARLLLREADRISVVDPYQLPSPSSI